MRIKKGILALTAAAMLAATMTPVNTMAAAAYTPVSGTSCSFNKYLIMDAGDTVPNVTFSYTIAAGTARSADTSDNTVMQVLAGVGSPTIGDVTFSDEDTTAVLTTDLIDVKRTQKDRTGTEGTDTVQLDEGEKFATRQATVNFSGVSFDEPGIYRYVITETANAAHESAGIIHDTDPDRILDVYVTDDGSGALVVSVYVLHMTDGDVVINATKGSADVAKAAAALGDKTDGFTSEYTSKDLVFAKAVTGNQASRDKWFEFTAKMTNVNDDDVFVVSLSDDGDEKTTDGNASAITGTTSATRASNREKSNPTSVTGAQLKAENGVKFYLQHGQSIAIRGLALNAGYTVTEDAEDYKSTASVVTGYKDATTGVMGTVAGTKKAVLTSFQNQRNGIIPTGIASKSMMLAGEVVAICAVSIAMIFYLKRRRA